MHPLEGTREHLCGGNDRPRTLTSVYVGCMLCDGPDGGDYPLSVQNAGLAAGRPLAVTTNGGFQHMARTRRSKSGTAKRAVKATVRRARAAGPRSGAGADLLKAVQGLVKALPVGELEKRLAGLEKSVEKIDSELSKAIGQVASAVRGGTAKRAPAKRTAKRGPAKRTAKRGPAKRAAKRRVAKRATAAKPAAKRTVAKRAPAAKRTAAKRTAAKRTVAKRAPAAKRTVAKRAPAAKRTVAKRTVAKRTVKRAVKRVAPAVAPAAPAAPPAP